MNPLALKTDAPLGFEAVYEQYFDFVWRSVANRGVPAALIDDVMQEVFVVVHRKLPEYEGRASMRTWLTAIVRRVASDQLKKRSHQPSGDPLPEQYPAFEPLASDEIEKKEALEILDSLLGKMSDDQREAFVLLEIEGLSGKEIAEAIGVNENTIWTRIRSARKIFTAGVARLHATKLWRGHE